MSEGCYREFVVRSEAPALEVTVFGPDDVRFVDHDPAILLQDDLREGLEGVPYARTIAWDTGPQIGFWLPLTDCLGGGQSDSNDWTEITDDYRHPWVGRAVFMCPARDLDEDRVPELELLVVHGSCGGW